MAELAPYLFGTVLTVLAVFLILLVLVQRGRGGGLTGALGGMGGSSAFGAKAGDVFTRITVVAASIWIAVCVAAAYWAGHRTDALGRSEGTIPNRTIEAPPDGDANTADNGPRGEPTEEPDSNDSSPPANEGTPDASTPDDIPAGDAEEGE